MQAVRKPRWHILLLALLIQIAALLLPPNLSTKIHQIYLKSFMAAEQSSLPAIPKSDSENDEFGRHVRVRRQAVPAPPPGWIQNGTAQAQPSAGATQESSFVWAPTVTAATSTSRSCTSRSRWIDSPWVRRCWSDQDPTTARYRVGERGK